MPASAESAQARRTPSNTPKEGRLATSICSPGCAMPCRFTGWMFSRRQGPPTRPKGASTTSRPVAGPSPRTVRSMWVGRSSRRLIATQPRSSTSACAQRIEPRSRSAKPSTTQVPARAAASPIARISGPSTVMAVARWRITTSIAAIGGTRQIVNG